MRLGVFLFGTDTRIRGDLNNKTLPNDPIAIDDTRFDLGFNVKLDAKQPALAEARRRPTVRPGAGLGWRHLRWCRWSGSTPASSKAIRSSATRLRRSRAFG